MYIYVCVWVCVYTVESKLENSFIYPPPSRNKRNLYWKKKKEKERVAQAHLSCSKVATLLEEILPVNIKLSLGLGS